MHKKYSFLMPYHDRADQLEQTLASFDRLYGDRRDWEVVLIVDVKTMDDALARLKLEALLFRDSGATPMKVRHSKDPTFNPAPHYNEAAVQADGMFLVLTSPEVQHATDVLAGLDREFAADPDQYVVCACEALTEDGAHDRWYQHGEHRDRRYHFCSAIRRTQFWRVGGFDETFAGGFAYDDDDWLAQVEQAGLRVTVRDDLLTQHQWHRKPYQGHPQRRRLVNRNREIFERKWGRRVA